MPSLKLSTFLLAIAFCSVWAPVLRADVKLPAVFGDHMVLQQDTQIPIWGTADRLEKVVVTLGKQSVSTRADLWGRWSVKLPAFPPDSQSSILTIEGKNKLTFTDVLVGDVWLCSGQSNMAFPSKDALHADVELPKANDPALRFFVIDPPQVALDPQSDLSGKWVVCTPGSAADFSAVGYFFARDLRASVKHPIGLLGAYWPGAPAEAFISANGLKQNPAFTQYVQDRQKFVDNPPPSLPPNTPTVIYNGVIAPLIPYAIKGVIWYQGEANASNALEYQSLFPRLITDWREKWNQGNFPFLYVQLPSFGFPPQRNAEGGWAFIREAQLKTLGLPNTGMAVTIDLGAPDLHPKNKSDVGIRLALVARHLVYQQNIVCYGPFYDSMKIENHTIRLTFKNIGSGLQIGSNPGAELTGFELAGRDKKFGWAKAHLDGDTVVVTSDQIPEPIAVRYGWASHPDCNLYNKEGLAASPFRTDDWVH